MSLIRFDEVSLDFGDQPILQKAELTIEAGERVCLIGRNGAGKSTTLRLIDGEIEPDSGEIVRMSGLVVSKLRQDLPEVGDRTVREQVRQGLSGIEELTRQYRARAAEADDPAALQELETLHRLIDVHGGWNVEQRVDTVVTALDLPAEQSTRELSGGWRRRVALAEALVQDPDLLLLDEPTNHLDIATIGWLENIVSGHAGAVLFITHDRAFLRNVATRILEIDRGKLTSWPGDYDNFLRRKEKALEDEDRENARFDRKLQDEEMWIRQGIRARRTRNEGRVRALLRMREERAARIGREGTARIRIEESDRSGRRVIRAKNVSYSVSGRSLLQNFSARIMRGDRIGILGNNGVGKTTLLRLLLGEIQPDSGTIKHGTNLEIGYFDQLRAGLDPEKSVADNVAEGRSHVTIAGKDRHIVGYLKGFLFSPKRSMMPVKALSGGERNRAILAKLFTRPANLLVLDEPTNDLDLETLEILEQRLVEFDGTLLVVSHDRQFLDNVVTSTLVFESDGNIREYVGGYSDWLRHGKGLAETDRPAAGQQPTTGRGQEDRPRRRPAKLPYHEQRELGLLPARISELEALLGTLERRMAEPDFYSGDRQAAERVLEKFRTVQEELDRAIERWTELDDRQQDYKRSRS